MTNPPPQSPRSYDVFFSVAGQWRFYLRNPNHGIDIGDDSMSWTADGSAHQASFADIVAIHLQTAALGNAERIIDQCKIEFANDAALIITNASSSGLPDAAQTPIYRALVHDLHARLARRPNGAIRFTAGMPSWRYNGLLITLIAAALLFIVAPLGLLVFTGDWHGLIPMGMGVSLLWPITVLMTKNAPRNYSPDRLPDELLS
jgi:hypothetical protein